MSIYIIMIDNRPYGYFVEEGDLQPQLENAKKEAIPKFEFDKIFYWHETKSDDEDTISKWKCMSIDKNDFMRYERLECILEVVKSSLIEASNENVEESDYEL